MHLAVVRHRSELLSSKFVHNNLLSEQGNAVNITNAIPSSVDPAALEAWACGTLDSFNPHAVAILQAQASALQDALAAAKVRVVRNQERLCVAHRKSVG